MGTKKQKTLRQAQMWAAGKGLTRFGGFPCKDVPEHPDERYTSNGRCVACAIAGNRNFYSGLRRAAEESTDSEA
jgi:hypothetical protein